MKTETRKGETMTTTTKTEMMDAVNHIWDTRDVREASDRCDDIVRICDAEEQGADWDDAGEWRAIRRAAIREYNDHCPIFCNG